MENVSTLLTSEDKSTFDLITIINNFAKGDLRDKESFSRKVNIGNNLLRVKEIKITVQDYCETLICQTLDSKGRIVENTWAISKRNLLTDGFTEV